MKRVLTCIVCPRGCSLSAELDESGKLLDVKGYSCPRGLAYAQSECTAPVRTLTTTVRTKSGGILPVKTSRPIPKELIFDCMKAVNAVTAPDNSRIGDVLVKSILGTDADLVATGNVTPF